MAEDVQELLLRVRSDRATIATVMRDLQNVRDGVVSIDKAKLNTLQSRAENTAKEFASLRAEIKKTADEIDGLNKKSPSTASGGFSGKKAAESVGNVASLLGSVGAGNVSAPIRAAAEISRVTEVLPQLAEQFTALGPLGIAAAAGVAVAAAAVALLDQQSQGLRDTVLGLIAGQKEYFELINKGSKEDLQAAIKTKQDTLSIAKSQRDELVKLQNDAFADLTRDFGGDLGARIGEQAARAFNVAGINDQDKAINDLNKTIAEQEFALGRLTGATQANITATNDLTKAHEAQVAVFIKAAKDSADEQVKLAGLLRTASSKQVTDLVAANKDRIDGLTTEANTLKSVANTSQEAKDRLFAIQTEINNLTAENSKLSGSILAAAKAREDEKAATDAQKKAQDTLANVKGEADADAIKNADAIKAITEKTAAAYQKLTDSYKQAGIDALAKRSQEDSKTLREQADEDVKTERERQVAFTEIEDKKTEALVSAEEKRADLLKKIRNQFALDEGAAIQNRDAVALQAAIDKRDKDSEDAEQAFKDDKKAAADARKDALKELRDSIKQQDTETRISRQNAARELSIARRNEDAERRAKYLRDQDALAAQNRAELAQQNAAYSKQLTDLQSYIQSRIKLDKGYFGDILSEATKLQSQLRNIITGGTSTALGGGGGSAKPATKLPPSGRYAPTQFAGGGYTPTGGLAMLHPGELVLTAQQQRQAGGLNAVFNLNGFSRQALHAEVDRKLDQFLDEAGY